MTPNDPRKKIAQKMPGSSAFKDYKDMGFFEKSGAFIRDTWIEITRKTTWPTRPELIRSTSVVLAAIIAVSVYLAAWDLIMSRVAKTLLGPG